MRILLYNFIYLFSLLLIIDFGLNPIWDFLASKWTVSPKEYFDNEKSISFLILIILIGPFLETLVFQKLVKYLLDLTFLKTINQNVIFYSIISGFLFGLTHNYSPVHILKACLVGFIFMFFYLKIIKIKNQDIAFVFVLVSHAIWNIFVWIYRNFI
jgi:hypothetical protein